MTQKNHYLIENKKPVETVYELKNEIPNFEEFTNSYEYDENVANSYESEYQERLLTDPQYGPWNETSKEVAKIASKTVISVGVAGAVLATGGAAAPVVLGGLAAGSGGYLVREIARDNDNEFFEWVGDTAFDTGLGLLTGSLAGPTSSVPNNLARHIAKETSKGGPAIAFLMRAAKEGFDEFSGVVGSYGNASQIYHAIHRDNGTSYKSDCPVCNK